jgi:hypothetical protein
MVLLGEGTIVKRRSRQVRRSSRETILEVWTLTLILDIGYSDGDCPPGKDMGIP